MLSLPLTQTHREHITLPPGSAAPLPPTTLTFTCHTGFIFTATTAHLPTLSPDCQSAASGLPLCQSINGPKAQNHTNRHKYWLNNKWNGAGVWTKAVLFTKALVWREHLFWTRVKETYLHNSSSAINPKYWNYPKKNILLLPNIDSKKENSGLIMFLNNKLSLPICVL